MTSFDCNSRQAAIRKIDSAMGDSVQNRNRRMFGNLLGHLNQARSLINKDQGLFDKQVELFPALHSSENWSRRRSSASERSLS